MQRTREFSERMDKPNHSCMHVLERAVEESEETGACRITTGRTFDAKASFLIERGSNAAPTTTSSLAILCTVHVVVQPRSFAPPQRSLSSPSIHDRRPFRSCCMGVRLVHQHHTFLVSLTTFHASSSRRSLRGHRTSRSSHDRRLWILRRLYSRPDRTHLLRPFSRMDRNRAVRMDLAPGRRGSSAVRSARGPSCRGRGRIVGHVEKHRILAMEHVPRGHDSNQRPIASPAAVERLRSIAWKQWANAELQDAPFDAETRVQANVSALVEWLDTKEGQSRRSRKLRFACCQSSRHLIMRRIG